MKLNSIKMMKWAKDLFPINRSITGDGLRKTIKYIQQNVNKKFKMFVVKIKTKVYDCKIKN